MSSENGNTGQELSIATERLPAVIGGPHTVFVGDFNTGKSTVINALLKTDLIYTSRTESQSLPTFLCPGAGGSPAYWRVESEQELPVKTTRKKWLSLRGAGPEAPKERALGVHLAAHPFNEMLIIDTPGLSSDGQEQIDLSDLGADNGVLLVLVTDIEYWNARHTIEMIARHTDAFPGRLLLLGNKADHLNVDEIMRIGDKAHQRMEKAGISLPPPFLPVSARLELARHTTEDDEYRHRTKRPVRQYCDWGFDQFRVQLYEFERQHRCAATGNSKTTTEWPGMLCSRIAEAFAPKEEPHEIR